MPAFMKCAKQHRPTKWNSKKSHVVVDVGIIITFARDSDFASPGLISVPRSYRSARIVMDCPRYETEPKEGKRKRMLIN